MEITYYKFFYRLENISNHEGVKYCNHKFSCYEYLFRRTPHPYAFLIVKENLSPICICSDDKEDIIFHFAII